MRIDRDIRTGPVREGDLFELFWENSALNETNLPAFRRNVARFSALADHPPVRALPTTPVPLARSPRRMLRTFRARRSERSFGVSPLSMRDLGRLLDAVSEHGGRRAYGSAGALYPCELVCLCDNVDPILDGAAHHFDPVSHNLSRVKAIPPLEQWEMSLNFPHEGRPQMILVVGVRSDRLIAKYGERGGRFALLEVGGLLQTVALQAARLGLAACVLGGGLDRAVAGLAGFAPGMHIAAMMAIGRR